MEKELLEAKAMVDKDFEYFKEHLSELVAKYPNKFAVIKDCTVIAVYDTFMEAYNETIKTNELGTFIIQKCAAEDSTAGYFHYNNVIFA